MFCKMSGRSPEMDTSKTLFLCCPACRSDIGEPEGVTGKLDGSADGVVILRCGDCKSIYLSPANDDLGLSPPPLSVAVLSRRRIRRWTHDLPTEAKILCVDCEAGQHLEAVAGADSGSWVLEGTEGNSRSRADGTAAGFTIEYGAIQDMSAEKGGYNLVLLPKSLESAKEPEEFLRHVRSLLVAGGRAVLIASNADSSCCRIFRGRHWTGYQYPHTRQNFSPDAIRRLGESAGLTVRSVTTIFASDAWLMSLSNWFADWGTNASIVKLITARWGIPQLIASAFEGISLSRGRGSLLVAELEKE